MMQSYASAEGRKGGGCLRQAPTVLSQLVVRVPGDYCERALRKCGRRTLLRGFRALDARFCGPTHLQKGPCLKVASRMCLTDWQGNSRHRRFACRKRSSLCRREANARRAHRPHSIVDRSIQPNQSGTCVGAVTKYICRSPSPQQWSA